MDLTAIFLGFFGFLKLLTIMAFVLAVVFIGRNGGLHKYRKERGMPRGEDQTVLDDISRVAERMEKRLEALEKILEADDPKWRERAR